MMANLPSNINEIVTNITNSGLAYSNRYEVDIGFPISHPSRNPYEMRSMLVRCDSVVIPGRSLSTTPYRYYGPARNMPYEPIYSGEMNISIILSADLRERVFFERWLDSIVNPVNYKFSFYDTYITGMGITVLDKTDTPTARYVVEEVYPKAISDVQMGYDRDNDFLKTEVTLSFRKYSPVYLGTVTPPPMLAAPVPVVQPNQPPSILLNDVLPDPVPKFSLLRDANTP
jgi:hypothetical protein